MENDEQSLEGEKPTPEVIDLQGFMGKFEIPNQDILVRYVSTYAGTRDLDSGHNRLLKELKPMREKIDAEELQDLGALLQRDLNDSRVATELVPYLLGQKSEVAFFPAILAVLMPKGFIQGNGDDYPIPSDGEYGKYWKYSKYKLSGEETKFTTLSIYPSRTDILVLDGQHRASAFRYIADNLEGTQEDIYSAFYQGVDVPKEFKADLPVTVIWFESTKEINPRLISRNLFVDVNNSAREVSRARNILLDDREAPSLLTRFTYSEIAEEAAYKPGELSLLHTAFDIDSEIVSSVGHSITLTNPEYVYDIYSWLMLGTTTYDEYDRYQVKRSDRRNRKFLDVFGETFNDNIRASDFRQLGGDDDDPKIVLKNSDNISDFKQDYNLKLSPIIRNFFNRFKIIDKHYTASERLENKIFEEESATRRKVWKSVFKGGEGLYYTFQDSSAESPKIETYKDEINSIETKFKEIRASLFDQGEQRVNQAFEAIRTKAFQVGVFMSLRIYRDQLDFETYKECYDNFISNMNSIGPEAWLYVFNEIRSEILGSADPKKWPSYRNISLRICMRETSDPFYNTDNFKYSPEAFIVKSNVWDRVKSWSRGEGYLIEDISYDDINDPDLENWIGDEKSHVEGIFNNADLNLIDGDFDEVSKQYVADKLGK